jgi:hypothetical protein
MTASELLAKPWEEMAQIATQAIVNKDVILLDTLDVGFHQMFLDELWDPKGGDWGKLVDHLLQVTDSLEASGYPAADPIQKRLVTWEHLGSLAEGFRRQADSAEAAWRFVESRERGRDIVRLVAAAGASGAPFQELSDRLGVSAANLSAQLRRLEAYDVVWRRKVGRNVWVSLGRAGRAYAERRGWLPNVVVLPTDLFDREPARTTRALTRSLVLSQAGAR